VTFTVVEGPQFRVGEVRATGLTLLPEKEIMRQVGIKPGDVFNRSAIRDSVKAIEALYSTIGRASADVAAKTEPVPGQNVFNVTFEITEGPEVYVERINIAGNVRSQDKILRREIPLHEGDLYTLQKKERARQKLVNLGYFEKVDVTTQPGSDKTKIIVNVDVTEKPTGLFSLGGGYSSVDSFVGTIDLAQRNFLGRGWEAAARLRVDSRYVKSSIFVTKFQPIWLGHILSGRAEGAYAFGWSTDPLPLFERYYLGGPNSVRSFKFRELSPVDENGVKIGGNSEVLGNVE